MNRNLARKLIFNLFILFPVGYLFSIHYSNLYTGGDQQHYGGLYNALTHSPLTSIPALQFSYTGSAEPLYGLLAWLGSHIMPKEYWFSIFNAMLFIAVFSALEKRNASRFLYPLVFTNYYLFVLAFSAERLKFTVLLILLSYVSQGRRKYAFAGISALFHFQAILFGAHEFGARLRNLFYGLFRGRMSKNNLITLIVSLLTLVVLFVVFEAKIIGKLDSYSGRGLGELAKFLIFFIAGISLAPDKHQAFFCYLILAVATLIFGDDRINMVTFMFTLLYSFSWNKGINPITIILLSYYSVRGFLFLSNVAAIGTGFPQDLL